MNRNPTELVTNSSSGIFPPEEELAIFVKDAHKAFGVTRALNGVSFRANRGEIHAIVGGNGCGKSTLAKVLSGVLSVDKGEVTILGHSPKSPAEARRFGVAMVFQEVMVADEATITENLFAGADGLWSRTLPTKEKIARARSLMTELVGTEIDPQQPAAGLSLGIKAWITIGRALLCNPKVLILDESSAALDFDSTERLFQKMRELRDNGATIIIVTHRIAELIRISDRATVMRDGKNVGVLSKGEITEENLLTLMAGKRESRTELEKKGAKATISQVVVKASGLKVWEDSALVDFELRKGEIVGVTGLEGHGQDTFVRILAGVAPAVESWPRVLKAGSSQMADIRSLDDAKKNGVEFVSGDRKREGILPNLSIFENLLIPLYRQHVHGGRVRLIDWGELNGIFDWEVQRLSIKTGPKGNPITSLSGGNQQKVLIGRAFALRPRVLVLNDPARGIDVGTKQELYQHLNDFASEGNSVVYMSSELEEFIGLCSRVIVFRHGSIFDVLEDGDVDPVLILEAMFGHRRAAKRKDLIPTQAAPARTQSPPFRPSSSAPQTNAPVLDAATQTIAPPSSTDHPIKIRYF